MRKDKKTIMLRVATCTPINSTNNLMELAFGRRQKEKCSIQNNKIPFVYSSYDEEGIEN